MTSQTDVVNMTSSRQKENERLRQGKWQVMNKVSETKERRNLNINSHFGTSSSKLKFNFPGLINISWLFVLMCCLLIGVDTSSSSANFRQREKKILDEIIGRESTYDRRIRPAGANDTGPATVDINIKIRNIQAISEDKMEYAIQMTFRQQWTDSRLIFDNMGGRIQYLTLTETHMVWTPDLFFLNEKEGHFHNIILPNLYIRIYPDGRVLYSIRLSLTLSCPMNLKLFPLDRQQCSLVIEPYGWTTEDLLLSWKEGDPVQVIKNLHIPGFTLENVFPKYCASKTSTGEYSCLRVELIFKREFWYYLIQYYIPCGMLVIVSWVSFWLDQNAVPARVALGVTTVFTMLIQTSNINQSLPPVSYTKAIDVWVGVCLTFVFGALLEFALVNHASRSEEQREKMKEKVEEQKEMENEVEQGEKGTSAFAMKNSFKTFLSKFPTTSKRIDVVSRIAFPLIFIIFNLAYWSTYLSTDGEDA